MRFDADVPFATLIGTMRTAFDAGFAIFGLAVDAPTGAREITLTNIATWLPEHERPIEWPIEVTLRIDAERIYVSPPNRWVTNMTELEHVIATLHDDMPHERRVVVKASGTLPLSRVVAVLDVLAGPACELDAALLDGDSASASCRFWLPLVDLDPPLLPLHR